MPKFTRIRMPIDDRRFQGVLCGYVHRDRRGRMKTIHLSDGRSYVAELIVYRDWTTAGLGLWRLFWQNPGTSCGVNEESEVTGQPYYRTMREAIAVGERRYGIRARRETF